MKIETIDSGHPLLCGFKIHLKNGNFFSIYINNRIGDKIRFGFEKGYKNHFSKFLISDNNYITYEDDKILQHMLKNDIITPAEYLELLLIVKQ